MVEIAKGLFVDGVSLFARDMKGDKYKRVISTFYTCKK